MPPLAHTTKYCGTNNFSPYKFLPIENHRIWMPHVSVKKGIGAKKKDTRSDCPFYTRPQLCTPKPINPPTSRRRTRSTIPSETTPLGVGDWLTDKDILCWLNQEVCHMEIDEPCAWTLAVLYIKRQSKCMRRVESGTTLDNMA